MRYYTVHVRRDGTGAGRLALVKEGFSWPALLFTLIWALWHRLWWVALGLVIADGLLWGVLKLMEVEEPLRGLLSVGFVVLFGLVANDLRRWTLTRGGYRTTAVVTGRDGAEAERRVLDRMPGLLNGA